MAIKIQVIFDLINEIAPFSECYPWDNSGWLVRVNEETQNILIALDLTDAVIDEAIQRQCSLIITHHPVFFESTKKIDTQLPEHKKIIRLIQNGISLISAHTNMDKADGGINDYLAKKLGLQNIRILTESYEGYVKIAVFVPEAYTMKVMEAACSAGAGKIGNYSCCTFGTNGTGTFLPNESAQPFVGEAGKLHWEKETKLEMICPESLINQVVQVIKESHPYEMPAMDIYNILEPKENRGTARIGILPKEYAREGFIKHIKTSLGFETVRVSSNGREKIRKVAVCGGGGGSLLSLAKKSGADAYLTGELKHSDYIGICENETLLVEAGHYDTERCFTGILFEGLQQRLNTLEWNVHVWNAKDNRPFFYV